MAWLVRGLLDPSRATLRCGLLEQLLFSLHSPQNSILLTILAILELLPQSPPPAFQTHLECSEGWQVNFLQIPSGLRTGCHRSSPHSHLNNWSFVQILQGTLICRLHCLTLANDLHFTFLPGLFVSFHP